jgi:hypothetical protein
VKTLFNPLLNLIFWIPIVAGGAAFLLLVILLRLIDGEGYEQLGGDWLILSGIGWAIYFVINGPIIIREMLEK